jgi:hypothetical protein
MTVKRGTTNRNARGNTEDRRRRREYLVEHYRADLDLPADPRHRAALLPFDGVPRGTGVPACRCYRCGRLLTVETVSPDRRIPGCEGGTYARENIRPACEPCQSSTGGVLGAARRAARQAEQVAS